ncbi:pyridoxamine 5'-phosphate oxidase family protein [Halobacillus litoralis]|uniref:pyridoxamine 5'-phosphate oxidase family protein n=1 Tax=Halobacillus litoralis TaxID=45668 RepID=UPI001CD589CB|nr:pyridoxamine 5'-phosphate oxidase family protein [Halobacillus litoralis]MCA0972614.1 pyridoxamine 5'-phosphate oxidase family protein [Halobacillus litoralis]
MTETYSKVNSVKQLQSIQGTPGRVAANKVIHHLDENCRNFIAHSPFATISTSNESGHCDASPRGDGPGFAMILDSETLVLPERIGNKRMDSMLNLLENPGIGLLFMIPGVNETLRINGKAYISDDRRLLEPLEDKGHVPNVAIVIHVEECFIHCAKAFIRSHLWKPDHWPNTEELFTPAKMIAAHVKLDGVDAISVQKSLDESYTKRLY